jgi:hypothetical protein
MGAAAARLGCSVTDLRRAKAAGCDGFSHGRVKLDRVKKWLESNPPTSDDMDEEALKKRKLLAQCRKLELDEAIAKGEWTLNSEIVALGVAWGSQVRSELLGLISEAPTWQGLDAPSLQDRAKQFVNGSLARLSTFHAKCIQSS